MKSKTLSVLLSGSILALIFFSSCEGPAGETGPIGPTGPQGVAGANGVAGAKGDMGAPGTANVQYTEWKTPEWVNYQRLTDNTMAYLNVQDTKQPLFTKAVIDSALIYIYLKTQTIRWIQADQEYKLEQRISNATDTYGYFKIPGRTTSSWEDYFQYGLGTSLIGEDFFNPYIQLYTTKYDYTLQKNVALPELIGKNATFFKDLVKDLPQYRIVIVPASVKVGRAAAVDFTDYNAVKLAFNIPD